MFVKLLTNLQELNKWKKSFQINKQIHENKHILHFKYDPISEQRYTI